METKIPARKKPFEIIREILDKNKIPAHDKLVIHNEILFMIFLNTQENKDSVKNYQKRIKNIEQKNKKLWIILILTTMVITSFSIIHF